MYFVDVSYGFENVGNAYLKPFVCVALFAGEEEVGECMIECGDAVMVHDYLFLYLFFVLR